MYAHKASDKLISRGKILNKRQISHIHYHDAHELYYMLSGGTTYFIGDEIYSIEKGNFVYIPKGILHKTDNENCPNNERILLSFSEDIFTPETLPLLRELEQSHVIYIPDNHLPILEELLLKIEKEYESNQPHKNLLINLYIFELLTLISRYKQERPSRIHESDKIIYTISEYISNHFDQDLSLESLSTMFAISESYLSRKFKAVAGIGLNKYITYVRITNAEKMLKEGNLSITEVAEKCGYNDSNYFSLVFKKIKGITPFRLAKHS